MSRKIKAIVFVLLILLVLSSCTETQNITLEKNNEGNTSMILYADDFFVGILQDLSPYLGTDREDESVLDNSIDNMANKIASSSSTKDSFFIKSNNNNYLGNATYYDLNELLNDLTENKKQEIFVITNSLYSGTSHLDVNINMDNWDELCLILPFLKEENLAVYGPVYNHGLSAADYKEMIGFILGDDGPGKIDESEITLIFQAPSKITKSDGEMLEDNVTVFHIPLIQLLLLNDPISFECSW